MKPWVVLISLSLPGFAWAQVEQQCAACHGAHGEGSAEMVAPRIAGQPQAYLERQLAAYASGARQSTVMAPVAKGLSAEQRKAVAAHYAQLAAPAKHASQSRTSARAKTLVTRGDEKLRVQACQNCHGPAGTGLAPVTPYLAGQVEKYLEKALAEWKSGSRKTDPSGQMPHVAQGLSSADMRALAQYFGAMPAPEFAGRSNAARQANAGGTPTQAGVGRTPTEGVGVEGGSTSSGGSQGAGGGGAATGTGPSGSRTGGTQ